MTANEPVAFANEEIMPALRAVGLDVEEWMTGGGCQNVVVVLERGSERVTYLDIPTDQAQAIRYAMFCIGGWCEEEAYLFFQDETAGEDDEGISVDLAGRGIQTVTDLARHVLAEVTKHEAAHC